MSSRTNKSSKSTQVKGKSKKQEQVKRQKEPLKAGSSAKARKSKSAEVAKPVAKIPSSRADSSSNWKALLQKQGKSLPSSPASSVRSPSSSSGPMDNSKDVKRFRNSEGSDAGSTDRSRSESESRCPSQLSMGSEGACSSFGADTIDAESEASGVAAKRDPSQKVKQEFRALGLSESRVPQQHQPRDRSFQGQGHKGSPRRFLKKPPPGGLNEFGYFDYTHYGVLRTPITPAHTDFMVDTGIIAMDCEMVGVGPMKESALARVSIVNEYGYCLYDRFVKPKVEVTDYRTQFSGIRENDLQNAVPFQIVAKEVAEILKAHILIGHSLKSDLAVLYLSHPKAKIRDTAFFFKKMLRSKTPKLKMLVKKILGVEIQQGEHSSITDAQATMALYQLYQKDWEVSVRQSNRGVDVFKLALEEFQELKNCPPQTSLYASSQQVPKADWYETPDAYNSGYCNNDFVGYSEAFCAGSTGVSPSESPPSSVESFIYTVGDNAFTTQHAGDEHAIPYAPNVMPPNITYVQYPVAPPPAPVPMPFYPYGPMSGMIIPPAPMNYPPSHLPPQGDQHVPCSCPCCSGHLYDSMGGMNLGNGDI